MIAWQWRRPRLLALVLVADGLADLLAWILKELVARQRPAVSFAEPRALVHVPGSGSFPSGHAAIAFACAVVLARAAPRLAAALYLLAAGIAFSRVYVGVHYPLDVLAGALLGIGVATALLWLAATRLRSWRVRRAD